jgi:hypothetical protein
VIKQRPSSYANSARTVHMLGLHAERKSFLWIAFRRSGKRMLVRPPFCTYEHISCYRTIYHFFTLKPKVPYNFLQCVITIWETSEIMREKCDLI